MKMFEYFKNPNKEDLAIIDEAIKANDGYCCCLVEKNPDTKCMCKEFREMQESGYCHCGRYYKIQKHEIVALIHAPLCSEEDAKTYFNWRDKLEKIGFMLFDIEADEDVHLSNLKLLELHKAKIAKSDAVIVINEITDTTGEYIQLLKEWATDIGKPWTITGMLFEVEENEN